MTTPRQPHNIDLDGYYISQQTLMWTKVVTGLATLQDAIQTLSSAYIKHTNAVLGEHGAGLDVESALAKLGENPLLKLGELNRGISPAGKFHAAGDPAASGKKERKKRQHDPNAPKRPLTPFFLYMQTARPIIANDLGAEAAKGAVSDEGTRRWGTMAAEDKQVSDHRPPTQYFILTVIALDQRLQGQSPPLQRPHALLQGRQCAGQGNE
jgi:hypothetical protein